jgi:hypothetical protein
MPTDNLLSGESFLENRHTSIEPSFTGRKGVAYDWQQLLVPSDAVFEACLETLLSDAGDVTSPSSK